MKIRRLYIGDFGLFRNQSLEELSPRAVFICGANRSGKTTLLHLLRFLGYGFPRDASLPPPTDRYQVEADVVLEEERMATIKITGYGEPEVILHHGDAVSSSIQDLYPLDPFTYQQIFTIRLEELKREPEGLSRDQKEKIQSVLLGAGLSYINELPRLERDLHREGDGIGGKRGNPGVKEFKPYYQLLKQGQAQKEEALKTVDSYCRLGEELENCQDEVSFLKQDLTDLENERIRLQLVKSIFHHYRQMKEWEGELEELETLIPDDRSYSASFLEKAGEWLEILDAASREWREAWEDFQGHVGGSSIQPLKAFLLENQKSWNALFEKLSIYRERVKNLQDKMREDTQEFDEISREIRQLNDDFNGDLRKIEEIQTDRINQGVLTELIEKYQEVKQDWKEVKRERDWLRSQNKSLVDKWKEIKATPYQKKSLPLFSLLVTFILFTLSFFFHERFAFVVGILGASASLMTFFLIRDRENFFRRRQEEVMEKKEEVERRLAAVEAEYTSGKERITDLQGLFQGYRATLGLPSDTSPYFLKEYLSTCGNLKQRILRYRRQNKAFKGELSQMEKDLLFIYRGLRSLEESFPGLLLALPPGQGLFSASQDLFQELERVSRLLSQALLLDRKEGYLQEVEKGIQEFLGLKELQNRDLQDCILEQMKEARLFHQYHQCLARYDSLKEKILQAIQFSVGVQESLLTGGHSALEQKTDLWAALHDLMVQFLSRDDVCQAYEEVEGLLQEKEAQFVEVEKRREEIKRQREALASPSQLEEAHGRIEEAQTSLHSLAEEYAVSRSAAFLLAEVGQRLIKRTQDTLLTPASSLFQRLTGGEYQKIQPPEDLVEADFQSVLSRGGRQETTEMLSRGTREQLFLAVRLSRIQEIYPPLPVILDESMVNFDLQHLNRAKEILYQLTCTHQVFVLTCHPHLISTLGDDLPGAQFWLLEKGRLMPSDKGGVLASIARD